MRHALVSTPRHLLLVDLHARSVSILESSRPEYYGLSWFPEGSDLVLSHSALDNNTLVDLLSYARSEVGYLSAGQWQSHSFLSAPHQITCLADGRIVSTNTGRNAVAILDPRRPGWFKEVRLSDPRWDRLSPTDPVGDHLNSVFARDDALYIVAHRFDKGSQIGVVSLETEELLSVEPVPGLTGLHNIWVQEDGRKICCHSEAGALVELKGGETLWRAGSSIYTRGLAAGADYVLIGESAKGVRETRQSSMTGLWVLDRRTWRAADYLLLGPYGAAHEVRLLDEPDDAHHGHPFMGLDKLLIRDERGQLERKKLDQAGQIFTALRRWSAFDFIFGSPEPTARGELRANAANLCLALQRGPAPSFDLGYQLQQMMSLSPSHVSVVVGYAGDGADTNMAALLLQSSGSAATLTLWRHDGRQWLAIKTILGGLPTSGRLLVKASPSHIELSIDASRVTTVSSHDLGVERCDTGLGIRWLGSTIQP